jgi:ABC-type nitrate/sulfonate/bicarbonate transport system substrate-binding protein
VFKKLIIFALTIGIILALSVYWNSTKIQTEGYNTDLVRIAGFRKNLSSLAIRLIMEEKGFFEAELPEGVNVEWSTIPSSTDQRDAIVSGTIDIGAFASSVAISAIDQGLPITCLSVMPYTNAALYTNRETIHRLEDLNGEDKIIMVTALGAHQHLAFQAACWEYLGDAHKFDGQVIAMTLGDALETMKNFDDAQASVIVDSPGMKLNLTKIMDLKKYYSQYELSSINATSQKFAAENPMIIEAYYTAERETIKFISEHPEEAAKILSKYWEGESIENIIQLFKNTPPRIAISESAYDRLAEFMYEIGNIDNPPQKFSELPNYADIPKIP